MNTSSHLLDPQLERLAALEPNSLPVISLYLDTRPDQHGRDHFEPFVRKVLASQTEAYPLRTGEREAFEEAAERIRTYVRDEVEASANGVALFARAGEDGLFETIQSDAPIGAGHFVVSSQPYLYPLARFRDENGRYAALIADTHSARLYVFELGKRLDAAAVENPKVSRTQVGGWSQARYQRHVDNFLLHHGKDVVEALDRLVLEKDVEKIVLGGEKVIMPEILRHLPAALAGHVIQAPGLDMHTPEDEVKRITSEIVREEDAKEDRSEVTRLFDEKGGRGLGSFGAKATLEALSHGQVDELFIVASVMELPPDNDGDRNESPPEIETMIFQNSEATSPRQASLANQLVTWALRTRARIRFIEDASLLAPAGGVAAGLRYAIEAAEPAMQRGQK